MCKKMGLGVKSCAKISKIVYKTCRKIMCKNQWAQQKACT
jgi:hypothetical protein